MKKIILFSSVALAGMFAACNDDYCDQFNIDAAISDVKNQTFVLSDADYAKVADLPANKELALSMDPENKTFLKALEQVGKKKCFTDDASADLYLPAFLASRFPHADLGSKFVVTYNQYEAPAPYLADFEKISTYTLTSKDYENVWGKSAVAPFLSPATLSKIPALLSASVKNAQDGSLTVVNYAYSETEPSFGEVAKKVYQKTNTFDGAGNYVIVAKAKDGKYYPFGKVKTKDGKNYGYMYPAAITIENDIVSSEVGADCVVAVEKTQNGFNLKNGLDQYLYMNEDYNSFSVSATVPASAGDWKINPNGDGTFAIVNVAKNKTVKLNLYNGDYSFGAYPVSKFGIYLNASMQQDDCGFKASNISLGQGVSYVWQHKTDKKYLQGSSYNQKNIPAESYLVSTEIDLTRATAPELTFDGAVAFLKNAATDHFSVHVSTDFAGDAKTATWTKVNVPNWPVDKNFVNSGAIDLSAFKGKKIHIGFRYLATAKTAPTWRVKNVRVAEKDLASMGEYYDVMLYKEVSEGGASTVATRAAIAPTASMLFRYSSKSKDWAEYKNDDARVVVADPSVYASLGSDAIASPETVLSSYLATKYPYVEDGARMAVVYNKKKDQPAVMEFTFKGSWLKSTTSVPRVMKFMQEETGIAANLSVFMDESLLGNEGGFKAQDVVSGGLDKVWQNTTRYGWKATAFVKPNRYVVDSWLVSPALDLKKAKAPHLSFEEAANYIKDVKKHLTVVILTNYKGDVTKATQSEPLDFERASGGSWDFVKVKPIDLSAYVGQTIHIAFRYTSTDTEAATWEFKNIKVAEKDEFK